MDKQLSVVVATYNRTPLLLELMRGLAVQTVPAEAFEVIVVDDGSKTPARPRLEELRLPYDLVIVEQANAGAAAARHAGVLRARGAVVVILDDDMQVPPGFLEEHKRAHDEGFTLVLGHIQEQEDATAHKPLFERFHAHQLARFYDRLRRRQVTARGVHVCTGNVSFRRAEYMGAGGFDRSLQRSEDRELGVRLEKRGARLTFADGARSYNRSDHVDLDVWLRRAFLYGVYDTRIAKRHPDVPIADPWAFLFQVSLVSRPLVAFAVIAPALGKVLSRAAIHTAIMLDKAGAERVAIAGATLTYGLEYFRGVRVEAGSLLNVARDLRAYLRKASGTPLA
jgi:glycosyltransferase involved in cell wall biosynthesis